MKDLRISKVLNLSTAHVHPNFKKLVETTMYYSTLQLPTIYELNYGWLVNVPDTLEEINEFTDAPMYLYKALVLAHKNNCKWIIYDSDEEFIDELPDYKDAWL